MYIAKTFNNTPHPKEQKNEHCRENTWGRKAIFCTTHWWQVIHNFRGPPGNVETRVINQISGGSTEQARKQQSSCKPFKNVWRRNLLGHSKRIQNKGGRYHETPLQEKKKRTNVNPMKPGCLRAVDIYKRIKPDFWFFYCSWGRFRFSWQKHSDSNELIAI